MKQSNPNVFREFGYLAIGFAAILVLLFLLNLRSRINYGGPNYSLLGLMSIYWAALGVGLMQLKKWAVALFVASMAAIGVFVVIRSIIETPFPWTLANIALGLVFCVPLVPALRCWNALR
jgi:hypothetical protein